MVSTAYPFAVSRRVVGLTYSSVFFDGPQMSADSVAVNPTAAAASWAFPSTGARYHAASDTIRPTRSATTVGTVSENG